MGHQGRRTGKQTGNPDATAVIGPEIAPRAAGFAWCKQQAGTYPQDSREMGQRKAKLLGMSQLMGTSPGSRKPDSSYFSESLKQQMDHYRQIMSQEQQ